jgi:hypothetical protein
VAPHIPVSGCFRVRDSFEFVLVWWAATGFKKTILRKANSLVSSDTVPRDRELLHPWTQARLSILISTPLEPEDIRCC